MILALWATLLPLLQHPGLVRLGVKGFLDFRRGASKISALGSTHDSDTGF